jgi:hypothetical protein
VVGRGSLASTAIASFVFVFVAVARSAAAAPAADTGEADALFDEGRRLMDAGDVAAACPKLEHSFQLAPRLGTMLNLGACFERAGKLSRALEVYERAATLARQLGRSDREAAARELAAGVEAKLGKLLVITEEPAPDLVLRIDGEPLSMRAGILPLEPGTRVLVADAPGRAPFRTVIELKRGATVTVTVPRLRAIERPAPAPAPAPLPPPAPSRTLETAAVATGLVVAVAGLGVGTFFGLRAKAKHDESSPLCDPSGCTSEGLRLVEDAQTAGNVSTVAFVVGGAALATAIAVLVLTRHEGGRATVASAFAAPQRLRIEF